MWAETSHRCSVLSRKTCKSSREGALGAKLGAETTFPGLVPVQDVSLYIHTMEFFILWDISVFEIACQLLTLDKKNHTRVIPKGRMS